VKEKILITIWRDVVAPRFDLASEVLIATIESDHTVTDQKTLILPSVSPEDLCHLILSEGVGTVICNGIEKEYYEYLNWKKVRVIDSVMGPYENVLQRSASGMITPGAILYE